MLPHRVKVNLGVWNEMELHSQDLPIWSLLIWFSLVSSSGCSLLEITWPSGWGHRQHNPAKRVSSYGCLKSLQIHSLLYIYLVKANDDYIGTRVKICNILYGHGAFFYFFISCIFIDASGWVISDVSFGFMGGFGSCNIRPVAQMTQLALILLQLPSR